MYTNGMYLFSKEGLEIYLYKGIRAFWNPKANPEWPPEKPFFLLRSHLIIYASDLMESLAARCCVSKKGEQMTLKIHQNFT